MENRVYDEDYEYMKQSSYRNYHDSVASILQNFEKAKEWPDLINSLRKLHSVFNQKKKKIT